MTNLFSRLCVIVLILNLLGTPAVAKGFNFKDLLKNDVIKDAVKVAGVGFLIDKLAKPINSFINTLLANKNVPNKEATKVVPILTVGAKGHIGAAQVNGPEELIAKVKAVIQYEDSFQGKIRVKALIPGDSANPLKFGRVYGVGVTAIIDTPI